MPLDSSFPSRVVLTLLPLPLLSVWFILIRSFTMKTAHGGILRRAGLMCELVLDGIRAGEEQVLEDARRIARRESDWIPKDAKELCSEIFFSCYMGTVNSSDTTKNR